MTVLLNEGLSEINISKLLGHKNTRLVSTYAKLYGPTLQKEVFKAFDNINIQNNGK
jgi:site-specific recombinase XerD